MLPPVPLHFPRRQTGHSLLPPVLPQGSSFYGNMVTTNPENVFNKLIQRDRWNLKDMTQKDERTNVTPLLTSRYYGHSLGGMTGCTLAGWLVTPG